MHFFLASTVTWGWKRERASLQWSQGGTGFVHRHNNIHPLPLLIRHIPLATQGHWVLKEAFAGCCVLKCHIPGLSIKSALRYHSSTTRLDLLTSVSPLVPVGSSVVRGLKYGAPLHLQCLQPSLPESNYDNEANND